MRIDLSVPALVVALGIVHGAPAAVEEIPNAVVERHRFLLDRSTRVSLFDNRMAVATVREGDQQVYFRQLTLPEEEYEIYLRAILEVAETAGQGARVPIKSNDKDAVIYLNAPGYPPRTIFYSPLAVPKIHTARLLGVLDDIELRVRESSPSQEALRHWLPKKGDRVELLTGVGATVFEIHENGVVILAYTDTGILEVVPVEERPNVILRVLTRPSHESSAARPNTP
ncbi:MAG: hypothetical protein K8R59_16100 [Thermoanaerobaculales bacterium]|nr:hypothetical protein [Thermoanaerobaculales bacterium]